MRMPRVMPYTKPPEYDFVQERYNPRDYYGQAQTIAKKYCRDHPDAEKEVVYMAASEVAEFYDVGGTGTKAKFSVAVAVKIRTALLEHRRKKENMIDKETKAAMIADRKRGLTYGQIAIKYHMKTNTVGNNFFHWRQAGLLDEEIPAKNKKAEKKKPDPIPREAYPEQIGDAPDEIEPEEQLVVAGPLDEIEPEELDKIFSDPESPRYTEPDGRWQTLIRGSVPPMTKSEQMGRLLGALPSLIGACKVLCQTADEENGRVIVKAEDSKGKKTTIIMEDVS